MRFTSISLTVGGSTARQAMSRNLVQMDGASHATHTDNTRTADRARLRTPFRWTPMLVRGPSTGSKQRRCATCNRDRCSVHANLSCRGATGCTAAHTVAPLDSRVLLDGRSAATRRRTCPRAFVDSLCTFSPRRPTRTRCARATRACSMCAAPAWRAAGGARTTGWHFHLLRDASVPGPRSGPVAAP